MFWYSVAPCAEKKWSILFENQSQSLVYDSASDALKAACKAAEDNFSRNESPTGVRLKHGEHWRRAVTFGKP
jgi:hypothetical protein